MRSRAQERRPYDSTGRRAQAEATRERILATARDLFVERGYAGASVADIAKAAGVSTPTVFAGFKSKVNLLKLAVETSLVGDTESTPLHERTEMRDVHAGATAEEVLTRLAAFMAVRGPAISPIAMVMYAAADADPAIAELARTLDGHRLAGAELLAATVAERLGDVSTARRAEIRDTIWTLNSPHLYDLLVRQRGWTPERYGDWVRTAFLALIAA